MSDATRAHLTTLGIPYHESSSDFPRWSDWNHVEFEYVAKRTMTDLMRAALDAATAEWDANPDVKLREVECPLCHCLAAEERFLSHVGSMGCARNLLDEAIVNAVTADDVTAFYR
jgi:hypothetical protein